MTLTSGELFAGVAGLSRAVDEVFDATPAWFSQWEPPTKSNPNPSQAPSKVLDVRYPGVPNFSQPYWWRSWAPWQYGCIVAHTYRCSCGRSFPAFNNLWRHIGGPRPEGWGRHDGIDHRALDLPERTSP